MGRCDNAVCTTNDARQYFVDKGLTYDSITEGDIAVLVILLGKKLRNQMIVEKHL